MDPCTTALVLIDYQNDNFVLDGILRGVVDEPDRVDQVLSDMVAFVARAAETPVTIVPTPTVLEPDCRARRVVDPDAPRVPGAQAEPRMAAGVGISRMAPAVFRAFLRRQLIAASVSAG